MMKNTMLNKNEQDGKMRKWEMTWRGMDRSGPTDQ